MSRKGSDNKIQKLDFSDDFLLNSVEKRLQAGDYYGALVMLNKRNKMYDNTCDASVLAADIYEGLGIYGQAIDAWFHFLDTCNEADFGEGYEGLAVTYMNMGCEAQSAFYYHKMLQADGGNAEEGKLDFFNFFSAEKKPDLRLVHSVDGLDNDDVISRGVKFVKEGNLIKAREEFKTATENSPHYATAVGLSAMCSLMLGEKEAAYRDCAEVVERYPEDVQLLTTYCAVLGEMDEKERAKEIARKLAQLDVENADDLYKVVSALCETGLDKEAFFALEKLRKHLPNDKNVLYFYAVAAYRTGKREEAIDALDRVCTLYPRSAVAEYYLMRMRDEEDGGATPSTNYVYCIPEEERKAILSFLKKADDASEEQLRLIAELPELLEFFRIAFDNRDGGDTDLQILAASVAVKCRYDNFLRDALLNYEGNDYVKFYILNELTVRNEDNSFGTVICNLYKEYFVHKINVGGKMKKPFMQAFAEVYSKFALLGDEYERKICTAGENVYRALANEGAWDCMTETDALAAVIYREARLRKGERGIAKICELFGAKRLVVQQILDYIL